MKILMIGEAGFAADLLLRMQANGNDVRLWIKDRQWKQVFDGLIDKVDNWEGSVSWCDLIVFDHSGMSNIWEQVKDKKPCFGGSKWADKLEKDRPYAKSVFKQIGLKEFESVKVNNFQEAIKHVTTHKVRHVVKPVGKKVESYHIIISEDEDGHDAAAMLRSYEAQGLPVDYIEIEERKMGIEVGVSGWFISDGKGSGCWSGDVNINFEHKRYATGFPEGLGPLTGEMGTCMRYDSQNNKLFKSTLNRMTKILQENNYRGQIDISFIIDPGSGVAYPLEATPRLGYPACMIESALQVSPWEHLFAATAIGDTSFKNQTSRDWAIGVVVATPGFPYVDIAMQRSNDLPVLGLTEENINHVHLCEVKGGQDKENKMDIVTAPGMGYVACITGTGKTIDSAKKDCYWTISNLNENKVRIPGAYWRTDIGDRVSRQLPDIYRLGILNK